MAYNDMNLRFCSKKVHHKAFGLQYFIFLIHP
jgi:hypothetical protein